MKIRLSIILFITLFGLLACCEKPASGKMEVTGPWVLEVPEVQKDTAAFLHITNGTAQDDALIAASSSVSETAEIHEMIMEGESMKMRQIPRIDIPAGGSTELKRGGLHVMLINLKGTIKEGDPVELKLVFEKAGEITVQAPVKKGSADSMEGKMHH